MPHEVQKLVFIDEDQQKKYSKSTLSAINAQVAKYAHKQRKDHTKARSAPSSAAAQGGHDEAVSSTKTQDDPLNIRHRRYAQPPTSGSRRKSSDTPPKRRETTVGKERRKSLTAPKPVKEVESSIQYDQNDITPPEALAGLLQNLCRITKQPPYQAFPFFLNLEERMLAHYWFTEVLKDDFGMKLQLKDTFQKELTKYPLAFQVPLRWIIARAADRLNEKTGRQSLTTVYKTREKALNTLQAMLRDTNTPTDEVIGSILQSIVNNPEFRKLHLRAMDTMIESRGGLEAVVQQSTVTCAEHIMLQYTFAEYDITQLEELESLKSTFFEALLSIQERAQIFAAMASQMDDWAASVDLADCELVGGNLQKWSYTEQRKQVLSEKTPLGQLVRQAFDPNSEMMRKSRLFAALFQLNAMLVEYDTIDEKTLFLRRLSQAAETSASPDPTTGIPTIMTGAHVHMIGYVSRQIQEEVAGGRSGYDCKSIPVAIKGIAAIKIFGLLLDSMRQRLVQYLQKWLLGSGTRFLSASDVNAMSAVVTQLWLQKRRSSMDVMSDDYLEQESNDAVWASEAE